MTLSVRNLCEPYGVSPPAAGPQATDPLTTLLRQAADRAADEAVRRWLTALLQQGECASSSSDTPPPGAGQAERPPRCRRKPR
jgi:hypothetical protein